jgi:hypothetical protein
MTRNWQCSICKNWFEYEGDPPETESCPDCLIVDFKQETRRRLLKKNWDRDTLIATIKEQVLLKWGDDEDTKEMIQITTDIINEIHPQKLN